MPNLRSLHISHTDINFDSRILKEMTALSESNKYSLFGIGVAMKEGNAASAQSRPLQIDSIILKSRSFKYLPVFIRHALSLIELTVKMSVKAIKLRPNIVHGNDTLVLPLCVILKLVTGARLIYDAHELESNRNGLTPALSKITFIAEKISWPFIDYLIVVSPSIQDWYQNHIGRKPSEVILNSPTLHTAERSTSRFDRNYLRQKYNIAPNEKIFVYVGIFGRGRGIEDLIDIFSTLKGAHLVLIGYGDLTESIKKCADEFPNIHVHPAVPHEEVVNITRSADVGFCMISNVSLSDYYCLPNKLFEYCFAGVPVIASDFPDITNVVNNFNLGVCCGQEKDSIRGAIELFLNKTTDDQIDTETLKELSWESQKSKLLQVYEYVSSLR